jgi:hypothetical protein
MKNLMLAAAVAVCGLLSMVSSAFAGCQPETLVSTKACPVFTPEGDLVTRGTVVQNLDLWVELCYPGEDWQSQEARTGQRPYYVSLNVTGERGVMRGIPRYQKYEDMKDAKLITSQCYRQYYQPGWVVMTVTQCREEGFYVFLTTRVLGQGDHGKRIFFEGRSDLDQYAYRVRH